MNFRKVLFTGNVDSTCLIFLSHTKLIAQETCGEPATSAMRSYNKLNMSFHNCSHHSISWSGHYRVCILSAAGLDTSKQKWVHELYCYIDTFLSVHVQTCSECSRFSLLQQEKSLGQSDKTLTLCTCMCDEKHNKLCNKCKDKVLAVLSVFCSVNLFSIEDTPPFAHSSTKWKKKPNTFSTYKILSQKLTALTCHTPRI